MEKTVGYTLNDNGKWEEVRSSDIIFVQEMDFDTFMGTNDYYFEIFKYIARNDRVIVSQDLVDEIQKISKSELYDSLLISVCKRLYGEAKGLEKSLKLVDWLHTTNFYTSPASTVFHESYEGGLLDHHLNVASIIIKLANSQVFQGRVDINLAILIALVHDYCKIGMYEQYMKWQKDENNQWIQVPAFKRAEKPSIVLGHGESSMYIVQKFLSLKMEAAAAIRWHMGKWRVPEDDVNNLQYANENYPLVHLLQFADQLSITQYEYGWYLN